MRPFQIVCPKGEHKSRSGGQAGGQYRKQLKLTEMGVTTGEGEKTAASKL